MTSRLDFRSTSLWVAVSLSLNAQLPQMPRDATAELRDLIQTDQIQAASKKVQDVLSAPADVVILRSSELRALGYRTLGEAVSGVTGFRTNEDHAYQGLAVRGLYVLGDQNTRVLVLLDGHALNSPAEIASSKIGEDFGLPVELIDRIEIVRGPASSLYGNNAFQALINVVSVEAAGTRTTPFQAAAMVGTGGQSSLWLNGGFHLAGARFGLVATGFERTGYSRRYPEWQAESLPANADRETRHSAYLVARGETWTFASHLVTREQRLASAPYYHVPHDPPTSYRNQIVTGEFKWEPRTERIRWMVRLFGDRNEFRDTFFQGPTDAGVPLYAYDWDPDHSLGLELQGRAQLGQRLSLTFGTEQRFHRFSALARIEQEGGWSDVRQDLAYAIGNTYVEAHFDPSSTWAISLGLQGAEWRPSRLRSTVEGVTQDIEKKDIRRLTPRFTTVWRASEKDGLKFIYGQGFRFPTLFERYYTDGSEETQTYRPNPFVAPEVIHSEQVIWSRKWNPQWRTQASASFFQWDHQIQAAVITTDDAEPRDIQQYRNSPSRIQGRALEFEWAWRAERMEWSGGAGWYRWTREGMPLDNVSPWNLHVKAIHRLDAWSLAGEARYISGREQAENHATVPAHFSLRASLRWEQPKAWLQLTVEDLLGARRKDLVAREYAPITWMEGEGLSARLTLGYRF